LRRQFFLFPGFVFSSLLLFSSVAQFLFLFVQYLSLDVLNLFLLQLFSVFLLP